jgi:hypothetical protein
MLLSLPSSRKLTKAAVENGGNVFVDMECAKKQAGKQREKRSHKKNGKVWEYFSRSEGGWGETQNRKGLRIKFYPEEAPNRAASLLNYVKCYNK